MKVPAIKDLMREQATFTRYEDGKLWYQIIWTDEGTPRLFDFPIEVPSVHSGGAFLPVDKALTFMRWIRQYIEFLNGASGG